MPFEYVFIQTKGADMCSFQRYHFMNYYQIYLFFTFAYDQENIFNIG